MKTKIMILILCLLMAFTTVACTDGDNNTVAPRGMAQTQ